MLQCSGSVQPTSDATTGGTDLSSTAVAVALSPAAVAFSVPFPAPLAAPSAGFVVVVVVVVVVSEPSALTVRVWVVTVLFRTIVREANNYCFCHCCWSKAFVVSVPASSTRISVRQHTANTKSTAKAAMRTQLPCCSLTVPLRCRLLATGRTQLYSVYESGIAQSRPRSTSMYFGEKGSRLIQENPFS